MASVLLVEDETLIRMMVEDMVTELGHTVAAEVGDLPSALEQANNAVFDIALLDVQLGRDGIEPVARALAKRNIPFAFATGFGESGVPEEFRGRPWLQKPFTVEQLERCFAELLRRD
ncbi:MULTISPECIES: response regulator [Bradyrhizobium]|uniref:response regulator n=1 Tax=Bradyrhizobium TaxID=374 RepID=UPI0003F5FDBD|nr:MULTISPECIES: response regulator [Bradyrhizobium]QOG23430.1 response regulator [Bradyrhizobium sp. SEMIA]UFW48555.1 response regulator [Bradyrhizobium arachidis]